MGSNSDYISNTVDSTTDDVILNVSNLIVHYVQENETVEAVNGVSFSLKKSRTIGLVGETGAGKTTVARSLLNIVPNPPGVIVGGDITVCGHDMLKLSEKELEKIRGKEIAMIFQDPMTALNPVITVGDQIAESIYLHENVSKSKASERAIEMLELVGIPGVRVNEYPHQFSGGMKQRVVIAIALACSPHVLIADEPTTALDVTIQAQVLDMMNDLKNEMGMALVMITHDLGVVANICDDVAVMYAGQIVESGTLEEVFNETKHPYTEGLFNSLPDISNMKAPLIPIPGLMPDPTNLPKGCAFAPRCNYVINSCNEMCPEVRLLNGSHTVRCNRYNEPGFLLQRWGGNI